MPRPRKIEGAHAFQGQHDLEEKVAEAEEAHALTPDKTALESIVAAFIKAHPEEWDGIRLCPAHYALEEMVRILNG